VRGGMSDRCPGKPQGIAEPLDVSGVGQIYKHQTALHGVALGCGLFLAVGFYFPVLDEFALRVGHRVDTAEGFG
jgi:hypothetical protein